MLDKKGFLFTVTIFLILTYILLSISVWVKSVETSEKSFADFYKQSTIELAIEQITPQKMGNVSDLIMNRALSRLNTHAVDYEVRVGPVGNESQNIEKAMFELAANGSAKQNYFIGAGGPISQEENSSFRSWVNNLNASLLAIGVYVSDFSIYDFHFVQDDIDLINYSFKIKLGLKDLTNTSSVSRTYTINNQLSITGLVDPALLRETKANSHLGDPKAVYRMFFFNKTNYLTYSDIKVNKTSTSVRGGQGWFYGYLATAGTSTYDHIPDANTVSPELRPFYILTGTYSEITSLPHEVYEGFGGYILTNTPGNPSNCTASGTTYKNENDTFNPVEYAPPSCTIEYRTSFDVISTSKPFIVSKNFNPGSADLCPLFDGSNESRRCALFITDYTESEVASHPEYKLSNTYTGVYSVELIRDFVMCGYYTHNPQAPSYFQRLLSNSYSRNSTEFGIETFVIGIYANDTAAYDTNSRLDRQLFNNSLVAYKVRGLPGCKNLASCSDSPQTGIFAVSPDVQAWYDLGDITCDHGAGCD
ncbi:Uncharacterised protein [Candidatus Bilamarchaeum dharawalense]|uniref:Uncharacterized protein n=1 Tax=Candidatus Bilamarchaeum dharawalense TaxID=2885759 RepID=A0A5E4LQ56_9ARCH|nr:Uncharacterised protein [Candidatus Bilamarchaeum dharawalense]